MRPRSSIVTAFLPLVAALIAACAPASISHDSDLLQAADHSEHPVFFVSNDRSLLLRGDGVPAFTEGFNSIFSGWSRYASGECGVFTSLSVIASSAAQNAALRTSAAGKACGERRLLRLTLAPIERDGSIRFYRFEHVYGWIEIPEFHSTSFSDSTGGYIPIGFSSHRSVEISDDDGECGHIRFDPGSNGGPVTGADRVVVTRVDASTWLIQTQPDELDQASSRIIHHDKAWCESDRRLYHMPLLFAVQIRSKAGTEVQRASRRMIP